MKQCKRCDTKKEETEFYYRKKENRFSYFCKSCTYKYQKERWIDRKFKAVELMGGKCCKCGYKKNIAALEFHHLDPDKKDFDWGSGKKKGWKRTIEELKKCVLVCSNCHREIHYPNHKNTNKGNSNLSNLADIEPSGSCPVCSDNVFGTIYCCTECSNTAHRKVKNRPSKSKLKNMRKTMSWTAIGKRYGVSDNAIRKWAKQYGII
jgi:hypothetical protein